MTGAIQLNLNPDERTLRSFGFIALVGFGALAGMAFARWGVFALFELGTARMGTAGVLALLSALSGLFSLVAPRANKPIFVGLSVLTYPIGFVLSYVIMGAVFFLLFTPVHIGLRLAGRDVLERKFDRSSDSYWVKARPPRPKDAYFKQF